MNFKKLLIFSTSCFFFIAVLYSCDFKKDAEKLENTESKILLKEVADIEQYAVQVAGSEKSIDMTQFKKTVLNIPYANNKNSRQTLDITYPFAGKAPYKMILLIHGGGWSGGNKESEYLAPIFQATTQGYAVVSINYRLANEVTWPEPLHDAKAAVRFIRANANKYHLDAKNIVVWGTSAGGHIAEMLAATNNKPAFEDFTMGCKKSSSAVQGVVSWYGVSDLRTLTYKGMQPANKIMGFDISKNKARTHNADPIELVTKNFPPILLVHGTNDKIVPYEQSAEMQNMVNEITGKKTAELITFKGAIHGDVIFKTPENIAIDLNFVDKILFNGNNPYRNTKYKEIRILK